jgi:hypothetical protein
MQWPFNHLFHVWISIGIGAKQTTLPRWPEHDATPGLVAGGLALIKHSRLRGTFEGAKAGPPSAVSSDVRQGRSCSPPRDWWLVRCFFLRAGWAAATQIHCARPVFAFSRTAVALPWRGQLNLNRRRLTYYLLVVQPQPAVNHLCCVSMTGLDGITSSCHSY